MEYEYTQCPGTISESNIENGYAVNVYCTNLIDSSITLQDTLPEYFIHWLRKQDLSPKELVRILSRCQNEDYEIIMAESASHVAPVHIEDTVVVQAVDLQVYDAFLREKAGAAV